MLSVNVQPSVVHAGLLLVGAEPGHPVKFQPKFSPPTGTEVAIEVRWKDADGKVQSAPAQHWIRNVKTKKALDTNWVFAGSMFVTDEAGKRSYHGRFRRIDLRVESARRHARSAHPQRKRAGVPHLRGIHRTSPAARHADDHYSQADPLSRSRTCRLPNRRRQAGAKKPRARKPLAEAEKKAVAAAAAWLALVDRGEYAQAWDTAAGALKDVKERRDFVKAVGDVRKPLGAVKSRQLESKQFATSLPGSPDGQYFVLQYKTSFANRKSAIETVTPMLDKDKKWRVSGYYIK